MNTELGKYLRDELPDSDREEIEKWISEDPRHQLKLDEFRTIWTASQNIRSEYNPNTGAAWEQLLDKISREKTRRSYGWASGLAASIVLAGFFVFYYMSKNTTSFTANVDVHTPIELPDGSMAWINQGSELTFQNTDDSRKVILRGEAYFNVVPDPTKPFSIQTGELRTTVVGTSFNVDASDAEFVDVVVATGKVRVQFQDDSIFLNPGERGAYEVFTRSLTKRPNIDLNFDAWRTGVLTFENTSMEEVIQVLELHYDTSLNWDDTVSARLNGTFDNQTLEEVLEIILLSTDVQITKIEQ